MRKHVYLFLIAYLLFVSINPVFAGFTCYRETGLLPGTILSNRTVCIDGGFADIPMYILFTIIPSIIISIISIAKYSKTSQATYSNKSHLKRFLIFIGLIILFAEIIGLIPQFTSIQ